MGSTKCTQAWPAYCGEIEVPLDRTGTDRRNDNDSLPVLPSHRYDDRPAARSSPRRRPRLRDDREQRLLPRSVRTTDAIERAVLLVDERGTGLSDPLDCPEAQSYNGDWVAERHAMREATRSAQRSIHHRKRCRRTWRTSFDISGIDLVDVYGDSYGSFFSANLCRRAIPRWCAQPVFDGTYPIEGLDPWYRTTATRLRGQPQADSAPGASTTCPVKPSGDAATDSTTVLTHSSATNPLTTKAPDGTGTR